MKNKTVAFIPARGGSKGIPKKNLVDLNGKPLLHYAIDAAKNTLKIDEVWVSSDSEEIINFSRSQGAKTLKRPDHLCHDNATSESAIEHFCESVHFDTMVFIQATSPLITSNVLDNALEAHFEDNRDSTVSGFLDHGFWWNDSGPMFDPMNRPTRQMQGNMYKESGMFYITSKERFLASKCRYSGVSKIYEVDRISSLEVDSYEDLKLIEHIIRSRDV